MKRNFFLFLILIVFCFVTFKTSSAFFTSSATSQNNTFTTAEEFPTATPSATPTPTGEVTPTPIEGLANHIVISEVQIAGAAAGEDFIELYNPTDSAVDISGWKLRVKDSSGTSSSIRVFGASKTILAHGFFLWASTVNSFNTTLSADESSTVTITSGDRSVAFLNSLDVEIDRLAWGVGTNQYVEGTAFPTTPASNQSMERKAYLSSDATTMTGADATKGNGHDTDNNSLNFVLRTVSQPQNSSSSTEIP